MGIFMIIVDLKGEQNLYMKQVNSSQESIQKSTFQTICVKHHYFPSPVTHPV